MVKASDISFFSSYTINYPGTILESQQAISNSKERTSDKVCGDHDIFACTYGLLFFGTPHHGSNAADWLSYMGKVAALASSRNKSSLVNALRRESETLQNVTDYFVPMMGHFNIFFSWEQEKTKLPGKFTSKYIVTSESTALNYDNIERAGIAANHSNLVKFDASSPGFRTVVETIIRYCRDASASIKLRHEYAAKSLYEERHVEIMQTLRRAGVPVSTTAARMSEPILSSEAMVSRASTMTSSRDQECVFIACKTFSVTVAAFLTIRSLFFGSSLLSLLFIFMA